MEDLPTGKATEMVLFSELLRAAMRDGFNIEFKTVKEKDYAPPNAQAPDEYCCIIKVTLPDGKFYSNALMASQIDVSRPDYFAELLRQKLEAVLLTARKVLRPEGEEITFI